MKKIIAIALIIAISIVGVVTYGKVTGNEMICSVVDRVAAHGSETKTEKKKLFVFQLENDGQLNNYIVDYNHVYLAHEDGSLDEVRVDEKGGLV